MKRNSEPWFRFYVRTLNNPKAQRLTSNTFKGWVNLLCLAKESNGELPPVEDVSFRLRLSKPKTESLLKALRANGLVDENRMHDWNEMQYPSDSSTERVQRHRERREEQAGNVTSNVPVTAQIRVDKKQTRNRVETPSLETAERLADILWEKIKQNNPKANVTESTRHGQWAKDCDLMLRVDSRTEAEIRELITWSQQDEFWRVNILSMRNLRKHFDRMTLKKNNGIAPESPAKKRSWPEGPRRDELSEEEEREERRLLHR